MHEYLQVSGILWASFDIAVDDITGGDVARANVAGVDVAGVDLAEGMDNC